MIVARTLSEADMHMGLESRGQNSKFLPNPQVISILLGNYTTVQKTAHVPHRASAPKDAGYVQSRLYIFVQAFWDK